MIFFSIIIPTYNSEKTLASALNSIIEQSCSDFEILIIDGASTDKTLSVVEMFNDKRTRTISEKDGGVYDAMNKGIENANGDWLYFLGSDDEMFDKDVLIDLQKAISKEKEAKVIYGNVLINGDTGWGKDGQVYDGEFNLEKLLKVNISHQAIIYHKTVFEKCGEYNLAYKICADYDFNLRVASKFKLKYYNRIISKFNAFGTSTNATDNDFQQDFSTNIINYYFRRLYINIFKEFEIQISQQANIHFKKFEILKGFYLFCISKYFQSKRLLHIG